MEPTTVIFSGNGEYGDYQVIEMNYAGRHARVLFSDAQRAAQSGVALDGQPELLFDYNQRLIELISGLIPRHVLLIGGGACTLPIAIRQKFPQMHIDIVERDPFVLSIAKQYFDFTEDDQMRVFIADARSFVRDVDRMYDLIIIDAFSELTVPRSLQTVEAMGEMRLRLRRRGVLAVNVIASYYGRRAMTARWQLAALRRHFREVSVFPASNGESLWIPQNLIVIAQDGSNDIQSFIRYGSLDAGALTIDPLHDDGIS